MAVIWLIAFLGWASAGARPVAELLADLGSPDPVQREAAAWSLGAAADPTAAAALTKALGDKEKAVRLTAAWALSEIGTPEALKTVYALLATDKDEDMGVFVTSLLGTKFNPEAKEMLVRALRSHSSPAVRVKALELLDKNWSDELLPAFQSVIDGADGALAMKALPLLVKRKGLSSSDELLPSFVRFLGHADPKLRQEAVRGIRGFEDERVRELLERAISDKDPEVHESALSALASMVDRQSFPQLVKLYDAGSAKDRATILGSVSLDRYELMEPLYRKAIADRLVEPRRYLIGILRDHVGGWLLPADWLLPYLVAGAKDADAPVRADAAAGLAKHPRAPADALQALAKDKQPAVRAELLKALVERRSEDVRDIVLGGAGDAEADLRALAAEAIAACAPRADALAALQGMLKDPAANVRAAAVRQMGRVGSGEKAVLEAAAAALKDGDEQVRAAAVEVIGGAKRGAWIDAVGAMLADPSAVVRLAAIDAFVAEGDKKVVPHLLKGLEDADVSVRRRAVQGLPNRKEPAVIEKLKAAWQNDPDLMVRSFAESNLRLANAIPGQPSQIWGGQSGSLPPELTPLFVFPGLPPKDATAPPNSELVGRYAAVDTKNTPELFHRVAFDKDAKGLIHYTSWGVRNEAVVHPRFTVEPSSPGARSLAYWGKDGGYYSLGWHRSKQYEIRSVVSFVPSAEGRTLTYTQMTETVSPQNPMLETLRQQLAKNPKRLAETLQRMGIAEGPQTSFYKASYVYRRTSR